MDGHQLKASEAEESFTPAMLQDVMDGFVNKITGVGDVTRDKTLAGQLGGPSFQVTLLSGVECENRWRGSDLGGRIIETLADEMTREGWDLIVQPTEDDQKVDRKDWPEDPMMAAPPAVKKPGPLPEGDHEAQNIIEEMAAKWEKLDGVEHFHQALCYEKAYGGAAIMIGVDEGSAKIGKVDYFDSVDRDILSRMKCDDMERLDADDPRNLTAPLDETKIRSINHLTTFRGGWDGEIIAWRYYNDPRKSNYGKPSVYMVRNIGVPLAAPPAPGEKFMPETVAPGLPITSANTGTGPMIFWIHESRLLVFPGVAVSRFARVQMRGWGDSVFIRVNQVLSHYDQTWGGVAILMQEWAQGVLKIKGLAQMLLKNNPDANNKLAQRALMLQITQSIARCRLIDSEEDFKREIAPLTGIADVLDAFANRLAAAADMPVSLLMGQTKGGLGDSSKGDVRFFYDRVSAKQRKHMMPLVRRLQRLLFLAKDSCVNGIEPDRWSVTPRALYKMSDQETADLRNKQADTDTKYITASVLTPEEVAASRFGGAEYSVETVIDLEGRGEMNKIAAAPAPKVPGLPAPVAGVVPTPEENPPAPLPTPEEKAVTDAVAKIESIKHRYDLAIKYGKTEKAAELAAKMEALITSLIL